MGRECLMIQAGRAAVRKIDYDLLQVREVVLKKMQKQDMDSPAFTMMSICCNREKKSMKTGAQQLRISVNRKGKYLLLFINILMNRTHNEHQL